MEICPEGSIHGVLVTFNPGLSLHGLGGKEEKSYQVDTEFTEGHGGDPLSNG